jgi:heme A synthase
MGTKRFAIYSWSVLGVNLGVILWGGYVRASGSGAGCGSHWPLCNGEVIPTNRQIATLIELGHRLTSGAALLMIVALAVLAFRNYPRKHRVRFGALLSVIFIFTEALIGAGLVLFKYVADDASLQRALFISLHLANTFLLLGVLTLTAWWASGGAPLDLDQKGWRSWVFGAALLGSLILGISGAVAALGDTLFPASSLAEGVRLDFSPAAHLFLRLRLMHPAIAVAVSCYLATSAALARFVRPTVRIKRFAALLMMLIAVQLLAGLLNVVLLAPIWLQLVHLLLADAVWIALVLLVSATLAESKPETAQAEQMSFRAWEVPNAG